MVDPVLVNKIASIERCLARVRAIHAGKLANLEDENAFESVVLNLQRACESAIDLAMQLAARRRLGVPQTSREAFDLLEKAGVLDASLAERMRRMVGFRNVAVHDYVRLSRPIVEAIVVERLGDFEDLCRAVVRADGEAR